jgi:acetyl esterase/lipase
LIFGLVFGLLGLILLVGIFVIVWFVIANSGADKQVATTARTPSTRPGAAKSSSRVESANAENTTKAPSDSTIAKKTDNDKVIVEKPILSVTSEQTLRSSGVLVKFNKTQFRGKPVESYQVYIPPGTHADGSRPCVLVAPAGTTLMHGSDLGDQSYHKETLPYALAGMIVVFYSLDGPVVGPPPRNENEEIQQLTRAYGQFKAARGGVKNGSQAIDYVLKNFPQVDKKRIFTSGHSSAATVSLLVAANDERVRGCIAFAPITDTKDRFSGVSPAFTQFFPGFSEFVDETNPQKYVNSLKCPVFLFHARDDSNVSFTHSVKFAERLKGAGNENVKLELVDRGEHYQSMIDQGLDMAVEWLKGIE